MTRDLSVRLPHNDEEQTPHPASRERGRIAGLSSSPFPPPQPNTYPSPLSRRSAGGGVSGSPQGRGTDNGSGSGSLGTRAQTPRQANGTPERKVEFERAPSAPARSLIPHPPPSHNQSLATAGSGPLPTLAAWARRSSLSEDPRDANYRPPRYIPMEESTPTPPASLLRHRDGEAPMGLYVTITEPNISRGARRSVGFVIYADPLHASSARNEQNTRYFCRPPLTAAPGGGGGGVVGRGGRGRAVPPTTRPPRPATQAWTPVSYTCTSAPRLDDEFLLAQAFVAWIPAASYDDVNGILADAPRGPVDRGFDSRNWFEDRVGKLVERGVLKREDAAQAKVSVGRAMVLPFAGAAPNKTRFCEEPYG